jgi:hypothetical protein
MENPIDYLGQQLSSSSYVMRERSFCLGPLQREGKFSKPDIIIIEHYSPKSNERRKNGEEISSLIGFFGKSKKKTKENGSFYLLFAFSICLQISIASDTGYNANRRSSQDEKTLIFSSMLRTHVKAFSKWKFKFYHLKALFLCVSNQMRNTNMNSGHICLLFLFILVGAELHSC